MKDLADSKALVTGGGSGVGASIATALAQAGAKVTIIGRNQAPLESIAGQHAGIDWEICDVTDASGLGAVVEKYGAFDIAVANAGQAVSKPFDKMDASDLESMLDINLGGVFNTWKAVLADMKQNGWGRLLAIASTAGLKGYPYVSGYCAAKHGVIGLTKSRAVELGREAITVNCICPGPIRTAMTAEIPEEDKLVFAKRRTALGHTCSSG
ncbi:MAG: SDR family oxidoreductase [Pseudomonadota bacterium]